MFSKKQERWLGTPIRTPQLLLVMFTQKTKAFARTADPEHHSVHAFPRKQKALLGTLIRDAQLFQIVFFIKKQKPLLGTLRRDTMAFS